MAYKKGIEERKHWRPHQKTADLMRQVLEILDEYKAHLPLTIRQIFYRLGAEYGYSKTENAYKSLQGHLKSARYSEHPYYHVPWSAIRDDGAIARPPDSYADTDDFKEAMRRAAESYERNRQ